MARTHVRRVIGVLTTLVITLFAVLGLAGTAHAEDGYEYWNYFHEKNGAWEFSMDGVADYTPEDGAVEAFRYGTSTTSQGIEPRVDLTEVNFETVCGSQEAGPGEKRVALILDYGTESDAGTPPQPRAACAVGDKKATTQQLLAEVGDVRVDSGMTCGIDGYPVKGCGVPVKNAEVPTDEETVAIELPADENAETSADAQPATAESSDEGSGLLWPLVGAGVLVLAIAGGGLALSRRNASA